MSTWVDHGILIEDPEFTFNLLERADVGGSDARERDPSRLGMIVSGYLPHAHGIDSNFDGQPSTIECTTTTSGTDAGILEGTFDRVSLLGSNTNLDIFFCLVHRRHAYEYRCFTVGSYSNDVEVRPWVRSHN